MFVVMCVVVVCACCVMCMCFVCGVLCDVVCAVVCDLRVCVFKLRLCVVYRVVRRVWVLLFVIVCLL